MKTVKCFSSGKHHIVESKSSQKTKCGKEIKKKLVGGWGVIRKRDTKPKNLCRACTGERR